MGEIVWGLGHGAKSHAVLQSCKSESCAVVQFVVLQVVPVVQVMQVGIISMLQIRTCKTILITPHRSPITHHALCLTTYVLSLTTHHQLLRYRFNLFLHLGGI